MKSHQRMKRKIQLAFGSAVLTLLAVGALSYRTIIVSNESELWVQHTHEVLEDLQGVLLASQSIEAAYRGFVLTGDESHLSRYQADIARLRRNQATLATLIADNPTQQSRLPTLLKLEEQKLQFAESVIRLRRTQGFEAAAALVRTADDEHVMDAFRDLIRTMRREEQALLTERTQAAKKRLGQTKIAMILSVLLGMSIATAAAWNVHRESAQRTVAEHALRESETKFRGLLEAAPDAMIVFDQAGTIVLLNLQTEKHFGYRREELVTQNILKIIPLGFAERFTGQQASRQSAGQVPGQFLGQVPGRGQVQSQVIELFGRRKDTSEFPLEIMVSPLESAKGLRMIAAIRNITERKKSEERLAKAASELRRSNSELQQFAYVASHDLQEPLRMVASYTQLLAKRYTGKLDPDADQFIAYAVDGCSRMKRLIEDLLAYSRAGTQARDLRESASESALKEALTNLRTAIQESAATITHDPMPTLVTDHSLLVQVLQNLVGNAIKYRSEATPQVHIGVRKNGVNEWIFSVRDNGLGIDPQYYEKIFQLFQRLHGRGEFEGTGIGLAICKKLIERLGGRIWVESQPQKGSTFYFALPEVVSNQTQTQSDSPSTVLNPIAIEQNLRSSATFPASL